VIVALDRSWYGKPVSEMAAANARKLREQLQGTDNSVETKAALLSLRGVAAANRNDLTDARRYFKSAYALDPKYAFAVNNIGYLAEIDGDLETAHDFYEEASAARRSDARVGLATSRPVEGMKLSMVADDSGKQVDSKMEERHEARNAKTLKFNSENAIMTKKLELVRARSRNRNRRTRNLCLQPELKSAAYTTGRAQDTTH